MKLTKFREIKKEIRIIGIDDCPFTPRAEGTTRLIGVIFRGSLWIEGVLQTSITIDGFDSTEKIIAMISSSPHFGQLRVIMLDGITFGGFNIVDLDELYETIHLPIIVICEREPDFRSIKEAIRHTKDWEKRWAMIQNTGPFYQLKTKRWVKKPLYFQIKGLDLKDAQQIIKISSSVSHIPEPVRVAHLIARSFLGNE
ncbi:MAG: endonuclease dU [Candidatus Helarchaeota archaeon]